MKRVATAVNWKRPQLKESKVTFEIGHHLTSYPFTGDVGTPIHWKKNGKDLVIGVATLPVAAPKTQLTRVVLCTKEVRASRVSLYYKWISEVVGNDLCH